MAKDSYWFKHDSTAGRGTSMRKMAFIYGHWGKGIYWDVIEMLRDQSNYSYPSTEFDLKMLADLIGCKDENKFINWFNDCVKFELFLVENGMFFSEVLVESMSIWESKRVAGSSGGKARAIQAKRKQTSSKTQADGQAKSKHKRREEKKREDIKDRSAQFDLFWDKYPNKTGKKTAREKFEKLTDLDIEKILLTVDAFASYKPFKDYNYPHATTYLNQRRWEDELPTDKPETNLPQITRDVWHIAKQIPAQMEKICAKYNLTEDQFKSLFK